MKVEITISKKNLENILRYHFKVPKHSQFKFNIVENEKRGYNAVGHDFKRNAR